ncbi:MAG: tripartite tricarboxylate transporter permease [Thermodesulfobacteriota bacterium]
MLALLMNGALQVLTPPTLIWLLLGAVIGLIFGVLPAIGATTGVVLFLPFTYGLDLGTAVVFLCAIYATGQYGDSVSSILLNTPGGPGTVASCWDGYPMTRKGQAARALGISTFASMLGGVAGTIGLVLLAAPLTAMAMAIQPPEYFALGVMALSLISLASRGETLKGLIMACVGLAMSFVGEDPIAGFVDRFSFGSDQLANGFPELTIFVALFAVAQIIRMLEEKGDAMERGEYSLTFRQTLDGFVDVIRRPWTVLRSIGIGLYIGILPALGVTSATIMSYLVEKKYSPDKDAFGEGAPAGLISVEVAKGTCVVGDMIPTFTLGIPGSITGAIVMTAFVLHGVQPGPAFLAAGSTPYIVFAGLALTQVLIVLIGAPFVRYFGYIVKVPNALLAPLLAVLCFVGAFVERNLVVDVVYLVGFGLFGYMMDRLGFSAISLILGLILGPLVETNFHRTLAMGYGSPYLLWTRPLTVAFLSITALFLAWPHLKALYGRRRGTNAAQYAPDDSGPFLLGQGEALFLIVVASVAVIMLFDTMNYPAKVALFPRLTLAALLLLILWRLGVAVVRRSLPALSFRLSRPTCQGGVMSWHYATAVMIGYAAAIWLVGFLLATLLFCAAVPVMLRYRRPAWILLLTFGAVSAVALFARLLNVVLPQPFWV